MQPHLHLFQWKKLVRLRTYIFILLLLLLLLLKDNPSFNEVRVGAPLRLNVSKDNVSITPVGDLLLGGCRLCMYPLLANPGNRRRHSSYYLIF